MPNLTRVVDLLSLLGDVALATPVAANALLYNGSKWSNDYPLPGPNYLANGGMWLAQRQTPGTLTTIASDKYSADRWRVPSQSASVQYQRTDTNGATESGISARYYGTWKQITNAGKFVVCQPLEGSVSYDLGSNGVATVTFQAKLKAGASKTIRLGLLYLTSSGTMDTIPANIVPTTWGANSTDPTWGTNLSLTAPTAVAGGASGSVGGNALNCSVTTSWQLFGATFSVPAGAKNLIPAIWTDSQFSALDTVSMTESGFYQGANCRPWTPPPLAEVVFQCERFYEKSYALDTAPGTASAAAAYSAVAINTSDFYDLGARLFRVRKRATPTVTAYSPISGASGKFYDAAIPGDIAATLDNISENGFRASGNSLLTAGHPYQWNIAAECEL